ncbi:MAG: alpha/beta hydrolase [Steroidobacteraceae bacterium]
MTDPLQESFDTFIARSLARPGKSRHARVAGIRMHYLEWPGPADAPALLLLHGFLAHAHWWDFVAPWLAEHYRVIAPDFGGMGDSEYRASYSHKQFYEEIAGIVDATDIGGCCAIGHSFGGRALLYACALHPALVKRAIVVDSRLGSVSDPLRGFDEEWRPKKRYPDEASILSRFLLRPVEPAPASALQHMARASIRQDPEGWVWKFDENVTRLLQNRSRSPGVNDTIDLQEMRIPVDFIYGEESQVVTPTRAALLAGCLRNVRTVTGIPCSHHHLPISQPIALLALLRVLLQQKTS